MNIWKQYFPQLCRKAINIFDVDSGINDFETFILMSQSFNLIAANSTFSQWASWFVQSNGNSAVVPVHDRFVASRDGSLYLNWSIYDMSSREIINPEPLRKDAWFQHKLDDFTKLPLLNSHF